ncbi:glycosyltransferase family 2 protein [Thomasclavelia cocleata]|uniref:glycosyltransferase family 2 protein n=1 Tax=Thomasclavelia cocleata TaxID=69824 RepID=UPI00242E022E|nr:glycosyltransferase [Thomasclavelia cocleata]
MISIIIPVYNVELYLDKCLQSVVNQTYRNIEIILIDDGASDNSGIICDRWQKKDSRIKVIHKTNGGLSSARNVGIEHANGEYLMFIDSDDIVSDELCRILIEMMKNNDADISICNAKHIFDDVVSFKSTGKLHFYNRNNAICELWYQKSFLPSAWGKLYKRELFKNIRFTEGIIFEDIDIMHELFYQCNKIIYGEMELYGYVHHENSITTKKYSKKDNVILNICDKICEFASDKDINLQNAAKSYNVAGALRVYLNAPNTFEYKDIIEKAKKIIRKYGKDVLKDQNIRKKNRYALYIYIYLRPLLKVVYKRVDRWK